MRQLIVFFLISNLLTAQYKPTLTVSPVVDQADPFNQKAILTLAEFLVDKDRKHWLKSDFENGAPYHDLIGIESGKQGKDFYKPTLMELIPTADAKIKVAKIAFVGYDPEKKSSLVKAIYNVLAREIQGKMVLSRYVDYATGNWKKVSSGKVSYYISPQREFSQNEAQRQQKDIAELSAFFDLEAFPIDYYSCVSSKELFEIKGFDYHPMMYADTQGGFALDGDIVLSGNNSEFYTHEIVHLYAKKRFPKLHSFWNEGIATYFGGSGKFDYDWQKAQFKKFLENNPNFNCAEHLDPYDRLYFEKETPIPYMIAAVICEHILRIYGKEKLFAAFRNEDLQQSLKLAGLSSAKLDTIVRAELSR